MNVLFATAEAVPFCKTGGLGDVCGSLPRELAKQGHQPTVILPAFRQVFESGAEIEPTGVTFQVPIGQKRVEGQFLRGRLPDSKVPVYFVDQPEYFDRPQLYGEEGEDYRDNCERFTFFSRAVLEAVVSLDLGTDLIHCHDWCTGLIPAYLKTLYSDRAPFDQIASLYTIHNLAYQGNFWHWDMVLTGIDWKHFNWRQMEFYGNLSFMKTGISFADAVSTVSPTYAREIMRPPLSCGLEGALQHRRDDLFGILNGADYDDWNPASDSCLGKNTFDVETFEVGKAACKAALQSEMGLPVNPDVPLLAAVGRLADQKGFDLIARAMRQGAQQKETQQPDAQWVILGTGEPKYHQVLGQLAAEHPQKIAVRLEFSNELAHQIEAGADMFLMPSQYEPCGLNQLYSLKYGTVPIVRATGGLADTVVNTDPQSIADGTATGFTFAEYTSLALSDVISRACQHYANKPVWHQLIKTGMQQDWSWGRSAGEYAALYQRTVEHARCEVLQ
ncbi:MAG: glycogen synthase GlgA [Planctomycetes bacterium]|nr:glycogen synthase GlgA [Planctomycetota bacterium]